MKIQTLFFVLVTLSFGSLSAHAASTDACETQATGKRKPDSLCDPKTQSCGQANISNHDKGESGEHEATSTKK